jgi:hypothetical protein
MNIPATPSPEEAARRNPAVVPDRVRQMQQVVTELEKRGFLQRPRYRLTPPLGGAQVSQQPSKGLGMMNRVTHPR